MFIAANAVFPDQPGRRLGDTAILERLDGVIRPTPTCCGPIPATSTPRSTTSTSSSSGTRSPRCGRRDRADRRARRRAGTRCRASTCRPVRRSHGRPGGPPPKFPADQFKTLTPMPYDEREEQTDPGRGSRAAAAGVDSHRAAADRFRSDHVRRAGCILWLLVVPALLLVVWVLALLGAAPRRPAASPQPRMQPVRERFALVGDLPFWLFLILATICADRRAGPAARAGDRAAPGRHRSRDPAGRLGVDAGQGRRRRPLAALDALPADARRFASWKDDRIALALFAHIAAPQIRLTKDPNTFFFFLDHLDKAAAVPHRGRHHLGHQPRARHPLGPAADREGRGTARAVVERQDVHHALRRRVWSGEVEKSLKKRLDAQACRSSSSASARSPAARCPRVPKTTGEEIRSRRRRLISRLDRAGAAADRRARRRPVLRARSRRRSPHRQRHHRRRQATAPSLGVDEQSEDLYWRSCVLAGRLPIAGLLFLRERADSGSS